MPDDAQQALQILAESVPVMVWFARADGHVDYYNRQWTETIGNVFDLTGDGWRHIVHSEDLPAVEAAWAAAARADANFEVVCRLRVRDGSYRRHRILAIPQLDAGGALQRWFGTVADVHAEPSEAERTRTAEAMFRSMADAFPQLAWTARTDGRLDWCNARFGEYTGLTPAETESWGWQSVHHPADVPDISRRWAGSLSTGTPFEMQLRLRAKDGTYRWFLTRVVPLRDRGRIVQWYGTSTDIDDQRRASEEGADRYAREHRIVERLQHAFLPGELPRIPGVRLDAAYLAAKREQEAGGDWYDAFALPDGRIAISIGDVTGGGFEAAIAMVRLRETLRATAALDLDRPDLALRNANHATLTYDPDALATAIFGIFDPKSGRFVYSCAGHPPPILARDGQVTTLPGGGLPIGLREASSPPLHEFVLEPPDVVVLYTDGLTHARRDVLDGEQRLHRLLEDGAHWADDLVDAMLGCDNRDDVAVLVLECRPAGAPLERPDWSFDADDARTAVDARHAFRLHLRQIGCAPRFVEEAQVVFGELVGNVVRHAPGPIKISLRWEREGALISVFDSGPHFATQPQLPRDPFADSGRGLYIVRSFADSLWLEHVSHGGKAVHVRLRADPTLHAARA